MNRVIGPKNEGDESYHEKDFEEEGVFLENLPKRVFGKLAERLGIEGGLTKSLFEKLCRREVAECIENESGLLVPQGKKGKGKNRIYWVSLFSAPKSVSVSALIGEDKRLLGAHERAVDRGLRILEEKTEVQVFGTRVGKRTGNMVVATFTHDDDRPVDGVVCPQLHTHANIMNMSADEKGKIRSLETKAIFQHQRLAGLEYQLDLASGCIELGYALRQVSGEDGWRWEIREYRQDHLDAFSLRSKQIKNVIDSGGRLSRGIATIKGRAEKDSGDPDKTKAWIDSVESRFSPAAKETVSISRGRVGSFKVEVGDFRNSGEKAVQYAIGHLGEKNSILTEGEITKEAELYWRMISQNQETSEIRQGEKKSEELEESNQVRTEVGNLKVLEGISISLAMERFKTQGKLLEVAPDEEGNRRFTISEQVDMERNVILRMLAGKESMSPVAEPSEVEGFIRKGEVKENRQLNESQKEAVKELLTSHDQIIGVQGYAGVGKTTVVSILKGAFENTGFRVRGLAPTARAAKLLSEVGIEYQTLQMFVKRKDRTKEPTVFVLDESSLASVSDFDRFFENVSPHDRVLLLGDSRQHQSVGSGCMFETLQRVGMQTVFIDEIVRQSNNDIWYVVQAAASGDIEKAMRYLSSIVYTEGVDENVGEVIREIRKGDLGKALVTIPNLSKKDAEELGLPANINRLTNLAKDYCENPDETLVVVPDNATRSQLNELIRRELQADGRLELTDWEARVLVPENDFSSTRTKLAWNFKPGQVLRLEEDLEELSGKSYLQVLETNIKKNFIKVRTRTQVLELDAAKLPGVSVYQVENRKFAIGEKVQFTSGDPKKGIANRQQGKIVAIDNDNFKILTETGEEIALPRKGPIHLDYAYGVTSYISQGQTAKRVLANLESYRSEQILNERLAYVVFSRAVEELRIYTDNEVRLTEALGRKVDKESAFESFVSFEVGIRELGNEWAGRSEEKKRIVKNWVDSISGLREGEFQDLRFEKVVNQKIQPENWRAGNHFVAFERKIDIDESLQRLGAFTTFASKRMTEFKATGNVPEEMRDTESEEWREKREALLRESKAIEERLSKIYKPDRETTPFVERGILIELERRAFERCDIEAFRRIHEVREKNAEAFGTAALTEEEKKIFGGWKLALSIQSAVLEAEKRKFDLGKQYWEIESGEGQRISLAQISAKLRKGEITKQEAELRSGIVSEGLRKKRESLEKRREVIGQFQEIFKRDGIQENGEIGYPLEVLDQNALKLRMPVFIKILDEKSLLPKEQGLKRALTLHFLADLEYEKQRKKLDSFRAGMAFQPVGYTDLEGDERIGRIRDIGDHTLRKRLADLRDFGGKIPLTELLGKGLRFVEKKTDDLGDGIMGKIVAKSVGLFAENRYEAHGRRSVIESVNRVGEELERDCNRLQEFRDEMKKSVIRWGGVPDVKPERLMLRDNEAEGLWKQAVSTQNEELLKLVFQSYEAGDVGPIRFGEPKTARHEIQDLKWCSVEVQAIGVKDIWTQTPTEVHTERRKGWEKEMEIRLTQETEHAQELLSTPNRRSPLMAWNPDTRANSPFNFGPEQKENRPDFGKSDLGAFFEEWRKRERNGIDR